MELGGSECTNQSLLFASQDLVQSLGWAVSGLELSEQLVSETGREVEINQFRRLNRLPGTREQAGTGRENTS